MNKVFYLEDRLNCEVISNLFGGLLKETEIIAMQSTNREEIKNALNQSSLLHVEYDFVSALAYLKYHAKDFAVFFLDRNLSEKRYDLAEAKKLLHPGFSEDQIHENEGEAVFFNLFHMDKSNQEKVYFLTAHADEMRQTAEDLGRTFPKEQILGKTPEDSQKVREIISNLGLIRVSKKYSDFLNLFEKGLIEEERSSFIQALIAFEEDKNDTHFSQELRKIFEEVVERAYENVTSMQTRELSGKTPKVLKEKLKKIAGTITKGPEGTYFCATTSFMSSVEFSVGVSLWSLLSAKAHFSKTKQIKKYSNSRYFFKVVMAQILELLNWYWHFCEKRGLLNA